MTEFEKMRNQQFFDFSDPEVVRSQERAFKLCVRLQNMTITDEGYRELLNELIPGIPESTVIVPPFYCDHGHGITIGDRCVIGAGSVVVHDIPSDSMAVGNPAKVIRKLSSK